MPSPFGKTGLSGFCRAWPLLAGWALLHLAGTACAGSGMVSPTDMSWQNMGFEQGNPFASGRNESDLAGRDAADRAREADRHAGDMNRMGDQLHTDRDRLRDQLDRDPDRRDEILSRNYWPESPDREFLLDRLGIRTNRQLWEQGEKAERALRSTASRFEELARQRFADAAKAGQATERMSALEIKARRNKQRMQSVPGQQSFASDPRRDESRPASPSAAPASPAPSISGAPGPQAHPERTESGRKPAAPLSPAAGALPADGASASSRSRPGLPERAARKEKKEAEWKKAELSRLDGLLAILDAAKPAPGNLGSDGETRGPGELRDPEGRLALPAPDLLLDAADRSAAAVLSVDPGISLFRRVRELHGKKRRSGEFGAETGR